MWEWNGALIKSWYLKQEYQSDNTGKILCHKALEGRSIAKISGWQCK